MDEDRIISCLRSIGLQLTHDGASCISKSQYMLNDLLAHLVERQIERLVELELSDDPTGQIPSAKNLVSFPPFSWRIVNTCLELTFLSVATALSALNQMQELRRTPVEAVAVDTNEECETASQAHTGTKK